MSIPTLKQQANGTVLTLHDKPYIMLAGEVGNSNSSSVEYMEGVWQTAEQLGMNTCCCQSHGTRSSQRKDSLTSLCWTALCCRHVAKASTLFCFGLAVGKTPNVCTLLHG